jgi:hypothetical protein
LNRLPELKSFLKDGEAESYRGVQIEYISGRTAALSVFHDGVLHEDVQLTDIATKDLMHRLMLEKGFVKKSDAELAKESDITERQLDEVNKLKEHFEKRVEERNAEHQRTITAEL